jgi:hypothetical protein
MYLYNDGLHKFIFVDCQGPIDPRPKDRATYINRQWSLPFDSAEKTQLLKE